MRITKNQLRQIIKEELSGVLSEERTWEASPEDKAAGISHYVRNPITLQQQDVYEPMVITGDPDKDLSAYAGISDPHKIAAGLEIYMPDGNIYTVKEGDRLSTLARQWGTDVKTIMADNPPQEPLSDTPPPPAQVAIENEPVTFDESRRRKVRKTRRK